MTLRSLVPRGFGKKSVPVRHDDDNPFSLMQKELDSLFSDFFLGVDMPPFGSRIGTFSPHVDVTETDKEIRVSAELPGMDEHDIDVAINRDALTISGEKKEEKEDKGKDYYRMERSYGSFCRTVSLPVEVETDKAEATFKKGVLTITLPKTAKTAQEAKRIAVKVE